MLQSTFRNLLPLFVTVVIASSCSSSRKATAIVNRNAVKGTWTLENVTYKGLASNELLRIKLLDEGTEACLTGSTWFFPNNGYGSYTISKNQTGCVAGQRNIIWSYRKEGDQAIFQYKRLEDGVRAKNIENGYRFKILSASDNSLMLQSEISYVGKPIYIVYTFSKS